jgi:hypothetical protein
MISLQRNVGVRPQGKAIVLEQRRGQTSAKKHFCSRREALLLLFPEV